MTKTELRCLVCGKTEACGPTCPMVPVKVAPKRKGKEPKPN